MESEFKSHRKLEEEIRQYKYERFESYMQMADNGVLERAIAITAFQEELETPAFIPKLMRVK